MMGLSEFETEGCVVFL